MKAQCAVLMVVLPVVSLAGESPSRTVVDGFETTAAWDARPADGVALQIGSDTGKSGRCMKLDFEFLKGGGYAVVHRDVDLDLPPNYAFEFEIRGAAPVEHLEFKLIDTSGENVWWSVQRDYEFPKVWETVSVKQRKIRFAWGPAGGGEIRHVAAIELAITAGTGGRGTVWLDDLRLRELPPPPPEPPDPVAAATSAAPGHSADLALDHDPETFWRPTPGDTRPMLSLDLRDDRDLSCVVIDWAPGAFASAYDLEAASADGPWRILRSVTSGNGDRDQLFVPETEAQRVRVILRTSSGEAAPGISHIEVKPDDWAPNRSAFFGEIAKAYARGTFPRGMSGEQTYWTVVGVDGDAREGLLGEDGALETGPGGCSIEPFLWMSGRLWTWADVRPEQLLPDPGAPIPMVRWRIGEATLDVTAYGAGERGASSLWARYRLDAPAELLSGCRLFLAIRPFQVNPPSQFLNLAGGVADVRSISFAGRSAVVNGSTDVLVSEVPAAVGAVAFDQGDVVGDYLTIGQVPQGAIVEDAFGAASGVFAFDIGAAALPATIDVQIPLHGVASTMDGEQALERATAYWSRIADAVQISGPDAAADVIRCLKAQSAWILVNRAGPAIQPGARSYARSWIRDGALTSSALLRLGNALPVREFIEWFAPYQYANGKVPCCVDRRGSDPVPENDSGGEFVFLVAEYLRYTGDAELARSVWPRVQRAVAYLDSLRLDHRSPRYQVAEQSHFYGLLPPSISHEGYSAKPMHSYWDDLWALRGFKDAAWLATELGSADSGKFAAIRDEFESDLVASIRAAQARHGIDYVPGCADLGDFDATSTTIALSPAAADDVLPREALLRTFERYWEFFEARRAGAPWDAFTPYEIRNIGAFVRLGWRDRAQELTAYFMDHRRPAGWDQWPEVVSSAPRSPRFLGDLPHTWVGSDFVRSVLDMFVYEQESARALVLGAGIPLDWLQGPGVAVKNLPTPHGTISFTMSGGTERVEVHIDGGPRLPAGGIILRPPAVDGASAEIDGAPAARNADGDVVVSRLPATVTYRR